MYTPTKPSRTSTPAEQNFTDFFLNLFSVCCHQISQINQLIQLFDVTFSKFFLSPLSRPSQPLPTHAWLVRRQRCKFKTRSTRCRDVGSVERGAPEQWWDKSKAENRSVLGEQREAEGEDLTAMLDIYLSSMVEEERGEENLSEMDATTDESFLVGVV